MISAARRFACNVLAEVELRGVYSDFALNSPGLTQLEERDRHLATELVYGVLRWQSLIDCLIARVSSRPLDSIDTGVRIALRMAVYQLWRMDRVPAHAAVDEAVQLARNAAGKGASGFANGILRQLGRTTPWKQGGFEKEFPAWIRCSVPEWLWNRWEARWGYERTLTFALSLNETPSRACRTFHADPPPGHPGATPSPIVPGAYFVTASSPVPGPSVHFQDEASQLVPFLFGDVRGWRIWDACAAPGGKAAILTVAAGPRGCVVSSELRQHRARRMAQMLTRLTGGHPDIVVLDARATPPFSRPFDAVLADVPCSGLGTLRRNPEIRWRFNPLELPKMARAQGDILRSVAAAVRLGGYLLYSTCSTEPEENEQVVDAFLAASPGFELARPGSPDGVVAWLDTRGLLRTFPSEHRWDGFFGALMLRRS